MKEIIRLLRPEQWSKNVFVMAPVFFGGAVTQLGTLLNAVIATIAFCLLASAIYCFNDIWDVEADRRHPDKCRRPVASGKIKISHAYYIMACLIAVSLSMPILLLSADVRMNTAAIMGVYLVMNILYTVWLKNHALIDVCIVATGFVLRVLAGSEATGIVPSHWIVLMTFLVTLFLALAKRRDDVLNMNRTGEAPRRNTERYNLTFINLAVTITATVCFVCYIMYTVSPEVIAQFGSNNLYLTGILVLVGLLRYIQITVVDEKSGDPTRALLTDPICLLIAATWLSSFTLLIYL